MCIKIGENLFHAVIMICLQAAVSGGTKNIQYLDV